MADLDLVYGCITREIEHAVGSGTAHALGEMIAHGIAEGLHAALSGAQASPSRDQLAAMALPGILTAVYSRNEGVDDALCARLAYDAAEAMVAERERRAEIDQRVAAVPSTLTGEDVSNG
jgi:hypothetical protein